MSDTIKVKIILSNPNYIYSFFIDWGFFKNIYDHTYHKNLQYKIKCRLTLDK